MKQSSAGMVALQARLNTLELEVARLNERMRTVGFALIGTPSAITPRRDSHLEEASAASSKISRAALKPAKTVTAAVHSAAARNSTAAAVPAPVSPPSPAPGPVPGPVPGRRAEPVVTAKKSIKTQAGAGGTKWFKPGEAVKLFQRILKQPMKFGDLYARVASSKRKSDLPSEDLGRFKWAVEAAVKTAIKSKALSRSSDGWITAVSDEAELGGDVDFQPAKKARTKKPAAV